jgi:DNA-binding CsgD family transcriptional regulator
MDADSPTDLLLTDTQLRILAALFRPVGDGSAAPATDAEIAEEVFLSVEAVEGHLRALYRKFGIADLPPNRRRARLVELAIEAGYVEADGPVNLVVPDEEEGPPPTEPPPAPSPAPQEDPERSLTPYLTFAVLILVVIAASLTISGIFNQGSTTPASPTPAVYRGEVANLCKLALADAPETDGGSRAERARGYLEVIETMRGRLASLVPPAVPDIALERFSVGLTNAASYTSDIASGPPAAGSGDEAKDVAGLTAAAGQVRSGARGYRLGPECLAVAGVVAASAQNAAAP